jgi:hypothetical protein
MCSEELNRLFFEELIPMKQILIDLSDELAEFLEQDPYVGDRSRFIAMLVRRFLREKEKSTADAEAVERDPFVLRDP